MHARICREEVNIAVDNAGELWHKRLCHMSQKGMRRLADDNLILEVKNVQLEKCTGYCWNLYISMYAQWTGSHMPDRSTS